LIPICISTVHGKGLPVLLESIKQYAPEAYVYLRGPESVIGKTEYLANARIMVGEARNFGEDYNDIIDDALKYHTACVVCNDDVVLTPTSYSKLLEDVSTIRELEPSVGWVAARSDAVRQCQNIRFNRENEQIDMMKFHAENYIIPASVVSPIFAYVSRDAWNHGRFGPLNWYSDDVSCLDMSAKGYSHYVSTSYVHHVGSQTIGLNAQQLTLEAMPWIQENRPQYVEQFFGS
jgi:hypothetical protein